MFGKFMNKKFFHPSSYPNQKQKWIHQQRADAKEKLENEKKETYQKEQECYQSRLLSAKTKEEKLKLDLNFLYDVPPGMKKDNASDEEVEVKFEWQKVAPRSKYVKDLGLACQDQPFGICVKNVRCFKCKQWGHQNTDRECPLFFANIKEMNTSSKSQAESLRLSDPLRLISDMKHQHGLVLKKSVIGQEIDPMVENNQLLESEDEGACDANNANSYDLEYISSLSNKEKKKLLKALEKFDKVKYRKKKKKKQKRRSSDSDISISDEEKDKECVRKREKHKRRSSDSYISNNDEEKYKECVRKREKRKRRNSDSDISNSDKGKDKEYVRKSKNIPERRKKKTKRSHRH